MRIKPPTKGVTPPKTTATTGTRRSAKKGEEAKPFSTILKNQSRLPVEKTPVASDFPAKESSPLTKPSPLPPAKTTPSPVQGRPITQLGDKPIDKQTMQPLGKEHGKNQDDLDRQELPVETAPLASFVPPPPIPVAQAGAASDRSMPVELNSLVDQITVSVDKLGDKKIEIVMSADTLDGLRVEISDHQGQVRVQLFSRTEEVSRILDRHVDQLRDALEARGVPVQSIEVRPGTPAAPPAHESPSGGERDSQPQSDGRQNREGRDDRGRR